MLPTRYPTLAALCALVLLTITLTPIGAWGSPSMGDGVRAIDDTHLGAWSDGVRVIDDTHLDALLVAWSDGEGLNTQADAPTYPTHLHERIDDGTNCISDDKHNGVLPERPKYQHWSGDIRLTC